jgi:hypothetical protein
MLAAGLVISGSALAADLDLDQGEEFLEYRHHIAVSLGNTHTEEDEDAFTVGVDYEYRLSSLIGVGVLGEYATGGLDTWVVGVPFALHPGAGWRLVAMPGMEIADDETAFLFRVGAGYEFEIERFTLMPEVNADFVDGETNLFFGASLGVKF